MSRRGRYVPISQLFNDDPEAWELTDAFGDRALRTWIEILRIMEETENAWKQVDGWPASLSRKVRQSPATVQRIVGWLLAKHWLEVRQPLADDPSTVLSARNYWKYHRKQETKKTGSESDIVSSYPILSEPILPKSPISPLIEIPDWIPIEPWERYLRHRKHKRAKVTSAAAEGLIEKLAEFKKQGEDISAILKQSVTEGWTGLFPVKANGRDNARPALATSQVPAYKPPTVKAGEARGTPEMRKQLQELVAGLGKKTIM